MRAKLLMEGGESHLAGQGKRGTSKLSRRVAYLHASVGAVNLVECGLLKLKTPSNVCVHETLMLRQLLYHWSADGTRQ